MGTYFTELLRRAWQDTWNVSGNGPLPTTIFAGVAFAISLALTWWWKGVGEVKEAIFVFLIAIISTLGALTVFFLAFFLYFSPSKLIEDARTEVASKDAMIDSLNKKISSGDGRIKLDVSDVEAREKLKKAEQRIRELDPLLQPLASASCIVHVTVENSENVQNDYMDSGGYLALGKGNDALIVMSDTRSQGRTIGSNQVLYTGEFRMTSESDFVGKSLQELKGAEFLQCEFVMIKSKSIKGGDISIVLNGNVRLKFMIPAQITTDNKIFVRNLGDDLQKYLTPK